MAIIDIIFLLIVFTFVLFGLWFGFIYTVGSTLGFFLGIFVASRTYDFFDSSVTIKILLFVLIYIVVGRLVGLVFYLIEQLFKLVSIIPFTKTINRLLGAFLGFIEGMFVVSGIIFIIHYYNLHTWFRSVAESKFAPLALQIIQLAEPFVVDNLRTIFEIIK